MREENDETTDAEAPEPVGAGASDDEQSQRGKGPGMVRRQAWAFFHPPQARWTAPGEQRLRGVAAQASQGLERSRGKQIAVGVAALVLVLVMCVGAWALLRPEADPAAPAPEESGQAEASPSAQALPDSSADDRDASSDGPEQDGGTAQPEPLGREADRAALKEINAGDGLVTARDEDADDPLLTGARFLRSLRSTDTTSDSVEDWYAARDSFLPESQAGRQTDWGEAGEQSAVSAAEVSWAEMDAAIEDGRGIAPGFEFGPEAQPGTHLVQVGMRLDRHITVDGDEVQTPSGALMEAVVVCPPAEGVERCVVTRWAEEPSEFVNLTDEAWEPGL